MQVHLRRGEAMIAFYAGTKRTYVWAVPKTGRAAFATVDLGREQLADAVSDLRDALEPSIETLGDIPRFDVEAAHEIYVSLLQPVQAGWRKAQSLIVIPHGALGYLPLSLLPTKPVALAPQRAPLFAGYRAIPWLARTHAVTVLPSAASFRTLRALQATTAGRRPFIGFGDPLFNDRQAAAPEDKPTDTSPARQAVQRNVSLALRSQPAFRQMDGATLAQLPRLAETRAELQSIALSLGADPAADVILGREANEDRVKTIDLSAYRVIAFATHGLVPGDLTGLEQPALALSAPAIAGSTGDGLLTMEEILKLKLNADWAVLSACNTAAADGRGADAISGLGRAFFYTGARALLVSNWPVHSDATVALTTTLFWFQAERPDITRAEALRQTMLALIDGPGFVNDEGKSVFSYAHPLFWAPFNLVGDGGGAGPDA